MTIETINEFIIRFFPVWPFKPPQYACVLHARADVCVTLALVRVLTVMIDGRQKSYVFDFLFDHGGQRRFAMQLLYNISTTHTPRETGTYGCFVLYWPSGFRRGNCERPPEKSRGKAAEVHCRGRRYLRPYIDVFHPSGAHAPGDPPIPPLLARLRSTTLRRARVIDARETMTDGLAVSADCTANGLRFLDQP